MLVFPHLRLSHLIDDTLLTRACYLPAALVALHQRNAKKTMGFFLGKNLVCTPKVQSVHLLLAIYGYHLMSIINL